MTARAYVEADGDRDGVINALERRGLFHLEASLRADLVPMAFGWALLRKMGVRSFPSVFVLRQDSGEDEQIAVGDSHVFTAALGLADDVMENGHTKVRNQATVQCVCYQSTDLIAVSQALDADPQLDLAEVELTGILYGYSIEQYQSAA